MTHTVIDQDSRIFDNLKDAFLGNGLPAPGGKYYQVFSRRGVIHSKGKTFTAFESNKKGTTVVKAVCDMLPNMTYIGQDSADIDVGGCTIRLFHGGDGNSYALSYRLQKLCEAITGGSKPNILLAGHVHKFCYIFDRNIHAISVPAMQSQTSFMRARKLAAHTGFLILDFDAQEGSICNLSVNYYPFYA